MIEECEEPGLISGYLVCIWCVEGQFVVKGYVESIVNIMEKTFYSSFVDPNPTHKPEKGN